MEYKYSTIVDPSTYETEGLCEGIAVRVNVSPDLEEIGTFRAQEDWKRLVGSFDLYKGGLGPKFSFMAVSVPECLPERLAIISYANEFAFLHDGEQCDLEISDSKCNMTNTISDVTDNVGKTEV